MFTETPQPGVHSFVLDELDRYPPGTKFRFLAFSRDGTKLAAAGEICQVPLLLKSN
jgi:hypothetical protein